MNYNDFKESMRGKTVALLGAGISNRPLIPLLSEMGAKVTVCDKNTDLDKEALSCGFDVEFRLGDNYLKNLGEDIIFRSPGMRYDLPEIEAAVKNGSRLTSEMECFFDVCPCKIIGVTGSDGKTTTTTIIHKILSDAGYNTILGGNIGKPLLDRVCDIKKTDIVVAELSSFQLHTMKKSPHIAVLTNITPNHLDIHKSYEEYIEAKENIMKYQTEKDILVTNSGCDVTREIGERANSEWRCFSSKKDAFVHLRDRDIYCGDERIMSCDDIKVPGLHNVENYMAAIAAVHHLVKPENIKNVATTFGGVEHRIEFVREVNGVKYYNSSIDSSPNRSKATLGVFNQKVIMIAGGKDKGIEYDEIGPVIKETVKHLILIGKTADKIEDAVKNAGADVPITRCESYEEVVRTAYDTAENGDIVVLSPASTSFDMFKNFEERGQVFKKYVNEL